MSRLGGLVPWGLVGGLLIAHHVLETRRAASVAYLEDRLRRTRARLHAVLGIARRLRGERDAARVRYDEAADYVRHIDRHGFVILRSEDAEHLRAERDRVDDMAAEAHRLRGVVRVIADGGRVTREMAAEALGKEEPWTN